VRSFLGTPQLVRFVLRRDRIRLPVWILALVGLTYATVAAAARTYGTPDAIASYARNLGASPATIAMAGPPYALDTLGGILVYESSLTALVGVALMAAFTVVRHTRAEEEAGRTELLASAVVGRFAGVAAAVTVAALACLLVGLGVAVSVLAEGMPTEAARLYGAAVAALGLVFGCVAAVAAQLMTHARGATGVVLAVLGVSFVLRAVGDVHDDARSGWSLSWLSPVGWSQQVAVNAANRWWPLAFSLAACGLLLAATVELARRRDVGSGVLPARPGPASAATWLRSPVALAWRLQRGTVLAWVAGAFLLGALFGSLSEEMRGMVRDNPTLADYFESTGGSITDSLFATALLFNGLVAGSFAVASALRLRHDETAGTLELVLSTRVSRARALLEPFAVTAAGTLLVLVAGGIGTAMTAALVSGETGAARLVVLALVYTPGVLVLVGLALTLTGWLPRAAGVAWVAVAVTFVVGWLGAALDLPGWVAGLSPFQHLPLVPVEELDPLPLVVLAVVGAVLVAAGVAGFRRRDALL
jgi:ABC-2 type transport system permease protein